jgi:CHAT domain-containing protein
MYDSLLAGNSITSALKAASEATLLSGNTSHPYYWAAFSAFRQY